MLDGTPLILDLASEILTDKLFFFLKLLKCSPPNDVLASLLLPFPHPCAPHSMWKEMSQPPAQFVPFPSEHLGRSRSLEAGGPLRVLGAPGALTAMRLLSLQAL